MSTEQEARKPNTTNGFAARFGRAILRYQSQIGSRVTYEDLAARISEAEGRTPAYAKSAVSEWVQGRSEPRLATIKAIADALGVSASWLAFGDVTQAAAAAESQPAADPTSDLTANGTGASVEKPSPRESNVAREIPELPLPLEPYRKKAAKPAKAAGRRRRE